MTEPVALIALSFTSPTPMRVGISRTSQPSGAFVERARDREIARAVEQVAHRTERRLEPERLADLAFVVRYLADCHPEPFHGRLAGWVRRAIRWHDRFAPPGRDAAPARAGRAADAARAAQPSPGSPPRAETCLATRTADRQTPDSAAVDPRRRVPLDDRQDRRRGSSA